MQKRRLIITLAVVAIGLVIYWLYPKHPAKIVYRDPQVYGMISSEETACRVAEAVWLQTYGEYIYRSLPFVATLKDSIWVVNGTLHEERGGTPYMEIAKKDGRILKITHYK